MTNKIIKLDLYSDNYIHICKGILVDDIVGSFYKINIDLFIKKKSESFFSMFQRNIINYVET